MECIKTLWVAAELPLFWAGMLGSSGYYVFPSILPLLLWNSTNKAVVSWLVFCTYIMIHDNKHFFGEHFKFRAKYALKEICHQIGGLDLSPVVFSTLPKGWWPFLHLDLLISRIEEKQVEAVWASDCLAWLPPHPIRGLPILYIINMSHCPTIFAPSLANTGLGPGKS